MGNTAGMDTHTDPRLEFVIKKLREIGRKNWQPITDKSGVPYSTIYKIAYRDTKDPRGSTLNALHDCLTTADAQRAPDRRRTKSQITRETEPVGMRVRAPGAGK